MEEKHVYSIIGKVEIGTDEYRDLIEGKLNAERDASEYRHSVWQKDEEIKKLTTELSKLQLEVNKFKKFIYKNQALLTVDISTVLGEE